jgi:hypothetical protein
MASRRGARPGQWTRAGGWLAKWRAGPKPGRPLHLPFHLHEPKELIETALYTTLKILIQPDLAKITINKMVEI